MKETVISKYSVIGDDIYYHHTVSEFDGADHHLSPEAHTQYEVLYLLGGELTYVIDGERYTVKEGDMIFVSPNELHSLEISGKMPYERIVLLFDMEILRVMMNRVGCELRAFSYEKKSGIHVIDSEDVCSLGLDRIMLDVTATADDSYKKLDIISKLIKLVISIDKLISSDSQRFKKPESYDRTTRLVTEYIEDHIGEQIRLDALAAELYVSKSTLCHKFSAEVNMSVGAYITAKKIYRAAELIRGGMSVSAAAEAVGYFNYTSFFYNYKKIMGVPPSDFSKNGTKDIK